MQKGSFYSLIVRDIERSLMGQKVRLMGQKVRLMGHLLTAFEMLS